MVARIWFLIKQINQINYDICGTSLNFIVCSVKLLHLNLSKQYVSLFILIAVCLLQIHYCAGQTNQPPVISAQGDFAYCPLSRTPVVTSFAITDPDDTQIEAFFVQISIGYQRGFDQLSLTGTHPTVTTSWNDAQGKLTLTGIAGSPLVYADLIPAIYDVVFESTATNPTQEKQFSFTIGEANYLPQTEHYYEYVENLGITWQAARTEAEARTYFGLRGYLATITSQEEAQLSGEQAAGAGWIGGSDEAAEGTWRWMTGPEAGTVFWNGGINGNSPNFAFWNTAEPNNCCGGEHYAHVTSPNIGIEGTWNDLTNQGAESGDFQPKGYIVEYGGFPDDPELQLSASTKLTVPFISSAKRSSNCGSGSVTLEAIPSVGEVLWFDAPEGGNLVHTGTVYNTPILNESTSFYVLASADGCALGQRTEIPAVISPIPIIETVLLFKNCDEDGNPDGIVDFNLNEATPIITLENDDFLVSYHLSMADAEAGVNQVETVPFSNATTSTLYARTENSFGCYAISTIDLEVSITSFPPNFVAEIEVCDLDEPDGFYDFDLAQVEAELLAQFPSGQSLKASFYKSAENAVLEEEEIQNTALFRNESPFSQTLFVRIESETDGSCFGIGPHVRLEVLPVVEFNLADEIQICEGTPEMVEVTNAQGDYIYGWIDDNGTVVSNESFASLTTAGTYTVTAISADGCISTPKIIEVTVSNAPNLNLDVVSTDEENGINRIVIQSENLGLGNYEFSLDNPFGPFQDNPIFDDVLPGIHTVYAVDKNGCGGDLLEIGVIGISNFITPNSDGENDVLEVLGVTPNSYQSASLRIFDRYGKLLKQLDGFSSSWDGLYQNQQLPASDYWYILEVVDFNGLLQKRTGNFTLKR